MAEPLLVPCAPAAVLPTVRWFVMRDDSTGECEPWAVHREAAAALGVHPKTLRQWMAQWRDFRGADVSDRLRVVPYAALPDGMKSKRGLRMISASAVDEYVRTVKGRLGQKQRVGMSLAQVEAVLPLALPRVSVDASTVAFDGGVPVPRARFVEEWLAPLARDLGYRLVARAEPAAPAEEPVNVCQVRRKRKEQA